MPHLTEKIYLNLKQEFKLETESIHLFDWPRSDEKEIDKGLEDNIDISQNIVQAVLSARDRSGYGVRWPLKTVNIVTKEEKAVEAAEKMIGLIKNMTNIKNINVQETMPGIKLSVKPNFKNIGKDFGKDTAKIIAKIGSESDKTMLGHIDQDGKFDLKIDGNDFEIKKDHLNIEREVPEGFIEAEFKYGLVYLDTHMDDKLEAEGYSRELMRRIQQLRKKSGLEKVDKISLFVKASEELVGMFEEHSKMIKEKVGAEQLNISTNEPSKKHSFSSKEKVKGKEFELFMGKV
jgi:isoleucyl-tRNA synthetase